MALNKWMTKKKAPAADADSRTSTSTKKGRCLFVLWTKPLFDPPLSRTVILRALLIVSLLGAVSVCTTMSYVILKDAEREVGYQKYRSIAESALTGAQAITMRKEQGSLVMATLLSHILPDPKRDWPLVEFDGYIPVAQTVADLSDSGTVSFMVLLDQDPLTQGPALEAHAQRIYTTQGRPPGVGVSDFGFGIWKPDPQRPCAFDDCRLPDDMSGNSTWGGKHNIMVPLLMHNQPGASSLLYNLYAQENRGIHIDSMLDCVEAAKGAASPKCAVMTDMLVLQIRPGPAGLLFQPIFPANDPSVFVGFVTTSMHWQEVLLSVVPDYVTGLTCVVSTATSAYTYIIRKGKPELQGDGDLHDRTYTKYGRSVVLNSVASLGAKSSAQYTLTVYPTDDILDAFSTSNPVTVSIGFFGVIIFCTLIFFLYDYLMRYEASRRKNILEMKRRFVRFISHEIRTPLNTVCMGLELLESELAILSKQNNNTHPKSSSSSSLHNVDNEEEVDETDKHQGQYMRVCGDEDIAFCRNVTVDVRENAHTAVEILNDLLNYDKLETGTLKLETGIVFIWDLVERTVNQFRIQAVNKQINFELHLDKPQEHDGKQNVKDEETGASTSLSLPEDASDRWNVIGDDVRLSQVIRNVISNALKFTHTNGTIEVTALHLVDGLPNAKPLCLEDEHVGHHPRSGSIQIRVQDSGVGLSKEQLQQLFSEGVQFDANRLQHGGGSGLGLSIAKGIVEQHNGIIRAESKGQGHGTCFIIELPLFEFTLEELEKRSDAINKLSMSQTVNTSESSQQSEEFVPRSRRILVAEDAESSRKMLIRLLERAGHTCVPAANGQEAVDAVKADMQRMKENPNNEPFDTIFMDFEMPILKGPDATRVIRQLGFTNTIVGVTGNLLSEDVEYFKSNGADDILGKPVSLAKLNAYWDEQSIKRKGRMEIFHAIETGTA